jgi:hypothetical protein
MKKQDLDGANGDGYYDRHGGKEFKRHPRGIPWAWWIVAMIAVLWALDGHAQQTLIYTGQPMPGAEGGTALGTIVLAQPLAVNGTQIVTPISYDFEGLVVPIISANNAPGFVPKFSFTTANGVIVAWSIMVIGIGTSNAQLGTLASLSVTDSGDYYQLLLTDNEDDLALNEIAGAWSVPQAQVAGMAQRMRTLSVEQASEANGYMDEYHTIGQLNTAIMACRHNPGRIC